ncbi:UDP-N-acetylmuramoyl-L-alanyl-D-glutamate--2,6-diaminopimelate ligase [Limihaloglobus sulfuriphilus]|uniref:UDP-N-acetylmuramoyl-L-alanyl-D-glutamate--2,6-diaminopimelate ligase n=1 Tax=Limihaloglobus sulfuriphilus TaxID=1851148 RepID=A0A1Q2MGF2_9BACT|nr:UDP-N-acetylmuramoyl-L-alanyl-D-glutamate--2,6-diaminopimelate ligase [Limihaloglobus sulfuriphilus]AQQ71352.1 UDP-N-acetylmuramoyl-L-alanyl-D-glutamate--2,6-diaminopimelate ligase [Limihaloglobus sulfuriphilus]
MKYEDILELLLREISPEVTADSRNISPGSIFVAIPGTQFDGHRFIEQAVSAGAEYVVHSEALTESQEQLLAAKSCSPVKVDDTSIALGRMAQAAYGNPAEKLTCLTVTGTNGKTTTAYIVRAVMNHAGVKCGMISTVCCDDCSAKGPSASTMTTPDQLTIARLMAEMVKNGAKAVVSESSSHAISQNRIAGIDFAAAAFTNLTGDHLDYHKTMKNYLAAKSRLFENLSGGAAAVLNAESAESKYIARRTPAKIIQYSTAGDLLAESYESILAENIQLLPDRTSYTISICGESFPIDTPLTGRHNVSNQLAAAGLCLGAGLSPAQIAAGLQTISIVPGRLERVDAGQDFTVLVDYAHTDDALKNVLVSLKRLPHNRLIVVFGCGGDRDRSKRPRMAAAAAEYADVVIVTSDNPRSEDPLAIIEDIKPGLGTKSENALIEPDRKTAIKTAVQTALAGDIILIAGKGHETYQVIGDDTIHFDDRETARQFLEEL